MYMPRPFREITSKFGRAKGQANMAESKMKRAQGSVKGSSKSKSKSEAEPRAEPQPQAQWATKSEPISPVGPEPKSGAGLPVAGGMVGAIGAVLIGLGIADSTDDRLLLTLVGLPLGAILGIGVVISYRWAGLIDRSN